MFVKTRRWVPFGLLSSIGLVVSAALLSTTLTTVTAAGEAAALTRNIPHKQSGMPWASGSYMPSYLPSAQKKFAAERGAGSDIAMTYAGRASWSEITNPAWLWRTWADAPQTLVISSALFPETGDWSMAACAGGRYDAHWRAFGRNAVAAGMADRTVVRLAWEFNGSWVAWAAYRPKRFVRCWRHVVSAAESQAPQLRWDWTVNRGVGDALSDATRAWPGKRYVDFVGIDSYDGYPAVTSAAGWRKQLKGAQGLRYWARFARRHDRKLSVPEWGLYPGYAWKGNGGGDNPNYMRKMFAFFRSVRGNLAYEAYFNDTDPAHAGALSLNPKARKEYRRQVRAAIKLATSEG